MVDRTLIIVLVVVVLALVGGGCLAYNLQCYDTCCKNSDKRPKNQNVVPANK